LESVPHHHKRHSEEIDEIESIEGSTLPTKKRKSASQTCDEDYMVSDLKKKRTLKGYTELHTAAEDGNCLKVAEILSTNDSSLWSKTSCSIGYTPLHVAIYPQHVAMNSQHFEVVRLLLAAGADIDRTAMELAKPNELSKTAAIQDNINNMLQEEKSRKSESNFDNWKTDVFHNDYFSDDNEF
jgi:ankyrin repeat protein